MSVRTDIEAQLQADWAAIPDLDGVRVIATERALDVVERATALIRLAGITKFEQAPLSHRNVSLLLTIISANTGLDQAADELETLVFAVLDYLDPKYQHGDATAVAYGNRLAYDILITVIAQKE